MNAKIAFGLTGDSKFVGWDYQENGEIHRQFYRIDQITGVYCHTYKKLLNPDKVPEGAPKEHGGRKPEWVTLHEVSINVIGRDAGATLAFFDEDEAMMFVGVCLGTHKASEIPITEKFPDPNPPESSCTGKAAFKPKDK